MTRIALAALCVLLAGPAWGQTSWLCDSGNPCGGPNVATLPGGAFAQPSGVTIGGVTLDLDKGTVDLHGAKVDDSAKAFWNAVQDVMGRRTAASRAYTLDDIQVMRGAVSLLMFGAKLPQPGDRAAIEDELISPEELERKVDPGGH